MDYAELAKRLRDAAKRTETRADEYKEHYGEGLRVVTLLRGDVTAFTEAADAIEALTSPPDEGTGGFRVSGVGKIKEI